MRDLADIARAREEKRSLVCPGLRLWNGKPRPAAFIICLSGEMIWRMLCAGLFIYEREPRRLLGSPWGRRFYNRPTPKLESWQRLLPVLPEKG